jgi:hypothetical protein
MRLCLRGSSLVSKVSIEKICAGIYEIVVPVSEQSSTRNTKHFQRALQKSIDKIMRHDVVITHLHNVPLIILEG